MAGTLALLTLVPLRSMLVAAFAVYLGYALHGLWCLAAATDHAEEQVTIVAIAQVGRGMCITLLAHLTMVAKGWSPGPRRRRSSCWRPCSPARTPLR